MGYGNKNSNDLFNKITLHTAGRCIVLGVWIQFKTLIHTNERLQQELVVGDEEKGKFDPSRACSSS